MRTLRLLALVVLIILPVHRVVRANPESAANPILEVLARVEQMTDLVESARADFTVRYLPTTEEEKRLLRLFYRMRSQESRADERFQPENQQRRRNYHSTWLRKGIKEREERSLIARPANTKTLVYDGTTVFDLDNSPFRSQLDAAPGTHVWEHKNRCQPFAFALEFRSLSHAEIIRRSPERRATKMPDGGMEVLVRHPIEDRLLLKFYFDAEHRLTCRESILTESLPSFQLENDAPGVIARQEFFEHKPYDDGKGNTIWFPTVAVMREYLGALPDGTLVPSGALQVDINKLEFNVEIPDDRFRMDLPRNTMLFDRYEYEDQQPRVTY